MKVLHLGALLLFLIYHSPVYGFQSGHITTEKNPAPGNIFDLLDSDQYTELSITTDIGHLIENKYSETYQPGVFHLKDKEGFLTKWPVEVRARGKYRRKICDFPPIKMKFVKIKIGEDSIRPFKSLKLVTHCSDEIELEEILAKEYLAYKIYNVISEKSLEVTLTKITWIDSENLHLIGPRWNFFIENEDEMATRLGGEIYNVYGVTESELNEEISATHALFQYLIGNLDWSVSLNRNIYMVKPKEPGDIMVVPYDFDFSGLVNASYAVAQPKYALTSIQERIYLGESPKEETMKAIEHFRAKKKDILKVISSFPYLSRSEKANLKKYIRSFYSELNHELKYPEFYYSRREAR